MGSIFNAIVAAVLVAAPAQVPISFPVERVLNVPWHHQEHNLTCEAAALRMALEYVGIERDEMSLLAYMTVDPRAARFSTNGSLETWGDPATSYVGNPDGRIERFTGYGVYNAPVARAAAIAGARVLASGSGLYGDPIAVERIYRYVQLGMPVVVWISNTYHAAPLRDYVAYDGAKVSYTLTEHAVTVVGVRPDAVLINDPWFGPAWHPKRQFESAYATFAQMAVVLGSGARGR